VVDALDHALELGVGEEGGGSAAEVDEFKLAAFEPAAVGVEVDFTGEGAEIGFHFVGVLVGVDAEVAEFAAFSTEGDVEVKAEARVIGGCIKSVVGGREMIGRPDGKRGVVGDEIGADFGFFRFLLERRKFHRPLSIGEDVRSAHPTLPPVLWWAVSLYWRPGRRDWRGG
jgi:hypothetical protein